jgi:lipopolysaccharide transport system ATP-binding protein
VKDTNTILSLRNVGVCFRRRSSLKKFSRKNVFWALKDVSFDVYQGEVLGIIGENGAGKSTLMSVLNGIIAPDKGEFINYGAKTSLLSLGVGMLPQLTGRKNAIMNSMLMGVPRGEIAESMPEVIKIAELGDFFDEPINTYSTGMRARLGFATAAVLDPDIILIDEVLGVGDTYFQQKSQDIMKRKIKSGRTVIIISHNQNTLIDLCDRCICIKDGSTVFDGDVEKAFEHYLHN